MIRQLDNIPGNMVAFSAEGEVTAEDYRQVVVPAVEKLVATTDELNYLMEINTDLGDFTAGAWWQDALIGIKKIAKWNRAAIVTDSSVVNTFTDLFSVVVPGEFRGYKKDRLQEAIEWVSKGGK